MVIDEVKDKYDLLFGRLDEYFTGNALVTILSTMDLFLFTCKENGILDLVIKYGNLNKEEIEAKVSTFEDYYIKGIIEFSESDHEVYKAINMVIKEEIFGEVLDNKDVVKKSFKKAV